MPTVSGTSTTTARSARPTATPTRRGVHRSAISTRKGGGYYGYKVHALVDVATELPVAWQVESAHTAESPLVPTLLDMAALRGFTTSVAILDRGYDNAPVYEACEARDIRPIIPLRETAGVKAG